MYECLYIYIFDRKMSERSEPRLLVSDMYYTLDAFLQLEIVSLCNS